MTISAHPRTGFCFILALVYLMDGAGAVAASEGRPSLALYGGPGTPSPLINIARARGVDLSADFVASVGYTHPVWSLPGTLALEAEAGLSHYFDSWNLFGARAAVSLRWLRTPWESVLPASVALGNGLSYAARPPELESLHLATTSRLLYYLFFEFAFEVSASDGLAALLRVDHRSGAFGLFDGVVGGSDYLCLGVRYGL